LRILVTRPSEDGEEIARRLAAMGHQAFLAPLLRVEFLERALPDFTGVQAILVTSANGVRALARRSVRRDIPVFAVGPQSTDAARGAGFTNVKSADGDAASLADMVSRRADPKTGSLLHVAGEEAGTALCDDLVARGFRAERLVLYRMEKAIDLPSHAAAAIRQDAVDATLFFSPQSAALFAACVARAGLSTARLIAVCISANTADALKGLEFSAVRIADRPNQDALLACL
jgi:uroporphyrinogen-III synthase